MDKRNPKNILVVDDEKIVRDFLAKLLTLENTSVTTAEDGLEAIRLANNKQFDIIFLDIRMPGLDGVATYHELKKITKEDTKYVIMTGYSIDDLLKKLENEKIEAFIRKPFEIEEILDVLGGYNQQQYCEEIRDILIVENENNVCGLFKKLLKGYNCCIVNTGQEALDQIKTKEFNLVFSDIILSDMSGIELYAKIKNIKPNLDIILIMGATQKKEKLIKGCLYKQINDLLN